MGSQKTVQEAFNVPFFILGHLIKLHYQNYEGFSGLMGPGSLKVPNSPAHIKGDPSGAQAQKLLIFFVGK